MSIVRIAHIDLTAFFVSVECLVNPALAGQPVIVGGPAESRGVVACASYEARKFGIHAGMATAIAERKCPHVIRVDGHYHLYEKYSNTIQAFLKTYAPSFEPASIDEFYLDWTGCERIFGGNLHVFALRLQKTILKRFGLTCAIGIASNKITAKVACDQAKPDGVTEVGSGYESEYLRPLPVEVLTGVGEVTMGKLHLRGIRTCGELAEMDSSYIGQVFGKNGLTIQSYARGYGDAFLIEAREQKQISREETFSTDTRDAVFLSEILHRMALEVSEELRSLDLRACCLHVKVRYSDWVQYARQMTVSPTHDPEIIHKTAWHLLRKADTRRVTIRLIGIGVSKFTEDVFTIDCFRQQEIRREWLLKAVDKINHKYNDTVVQMGVIS